MNRALDVLCLDIEGGFGGSSRSLYESLRHQDCAAVAPEVWCRRAGPIVARYKALGIPAAVHAPMPHVSSLPRASRNLLAYGRFALKWPSSAGFRRGLLERARRADLVHFNHEGLFLLARWLRSRTKVPFTMHIRTTLADSAFARWQNRTIAAIADRLVFITENERRVFESLAGSRANGSVIYNIAVPPDAPVVPHQGIPSTDARFRVASLSNYAVVRGTDRLVDIAAALARLGRRDVLFVVAGSIPDGDAQNPGGVLAARATAAGVADMFQFLGHVPDPERVLAACRALLKPTRNNDPWGRDIIEAMAMGKPVISVGTWSGFVESDVTGVLMPVFEANETARQIIRLSDDVPYYDRLSAAAAARVRKLCDGPARAADLLSVWREAAGM